MSSNLAESLLLQSPLCAPSSWESADQLAELFDSCVNNPLNQLIPMRTAKIRKRPSGLWFVDDLRRKTKQTRRRLERCLRLLRRHTSSESSSVEVTTVSKSLKRSYLQYRSLYSGERAILSGDKKSTPSFVLLVIFGEIL